MKIILYILLALLALLNLSNVLAIFGSGNPVYTAGLGMGILVLLGAVLSLLGIFGLAQNKSWGFNIAAAGLGLTLVAGILSIMAGQIWISQLVLPIIAGIFLFITKNNLLKLSINLLLT